MSKVNDSEERLAELIWRTGKLRVCLLVLTILVSRGLVGDGQWKEAGTKC